LIKSAKKRDRHRMVDLATIPFGDSSPIYSNHSQKKSQNSKNFNNTINPNEFVPATNLNDIPRLKEDSDLWKKHASKPLKPLNLEAYFEQNSKNSTNCESNLVTINVSFYLNIFNFMYRRIIYYSIYFFHNFF
jgi:hypothetical protein